VAPVFVRPVPAVRYPRESTYALLVASVVLTGVGTVTAPENDAVVPESAPERVNEIRVPTLVICVWDAFTDRVDPVFVKPVPAVRYPRESTYDLLVASVVATGVGTVTDPEKVEFPETANDESVPTVVICVCDELIDRVPLVSVKPVPAVR